MEMPYFEAALRRAEAEGALLPNMTLLVLGEDPEWARAQPGLQRRGAVIVEGEDEVSSLFLLASAGAGLICPNSTFCWWAAYLAKAFSAEAKRKNGFVSFPRHWINAYFDAPNALFEGVFDVIIEDAEFVFDPK